MFTAHDSHLRLPSSGPFQHRSLPTWSLKSPTVARNGEVTGPSSPLNPGAPIRNDLLAALSEEDLAQLTPHLECVSLKRRQVLHERNLPVSHAYFLERGAASLISRADEGKGVLEVGTLGRRDFVGVPIVLGTGRAPQRCMVQIPGEALRIRADDLRLAMDRMPALQRLLLGYVQAAMVQSAQLVVCNTRHSLRERLARWLLVVLDRTDENGVAITHQALGRALGVRRAGITTAMGDMEEAGLVQRGRGQILVLDRAGLEGAACTCYRTIRAEYQRLLCRAPEVPNLSHHDGLFAAGKLRTCCARDGHDAAMPDGALRPRRGEISARLSAVGPEPRNRTRERTEAEWRQALSDKDERFQDLHHRVKNSLQMISSLLAIETRSIADHEAAQRLQETQQRIQTLVRLHEHLYERQADGGRIDAGAELAALCDELERSSGAAERGIAITFEALSCAIAFDKLTPLALILSEVVTNAVKHAASSGPEQAIEIRVALRQGPADGWASLSVSDDGPGLPAGFDPTRSTGLGMRLVASFARQLGGSCSLSNLQGELSDRGGARFEVSFPLKG